MYCVRYKSFHWSALQIWTRRNRLVWACRDNAGVAEMPFGKRLLERYLIAEFIQPEGQ
jgi:hypothetical protein